MSLPADDGIDLINLAFKQDEEQKIFQRWIPYQEQFGFEEFKLMLIKPKKKTDAEIMDDVNLILAAQAKANGNGE